MIKGSFEIEYKKDSLCDGTPALFLIETEEEGSKNMHFGCLKHYSSNLYPRNATPMIRKIRFEITFNEKP